MNSKIIILITALFISGYVGAETPSSGSLGKSARIYKVAPSNHQPYSWVSRGQIYQIVFGIGAEECYLYHSREGKTLLVSSNIKAFSEMVNEEITDADQARNLLKNLSEFITSLFGRMCDCIIDEQYLRYRDSKLPGEWYVDVTESQKQQSQQILKRYISPGSPTTKNDSWDWTIYVTGETGSIEKWVFTGEVFPFKINTLEKTSIEKKGTIIPAALSIVTLDPKKYD